MSKIIRIPDNFAILVCDARKAMLLRNAGPATDPVLQLVERIDAAPDDGAMTDSDRPGRRFDGGAAAITSGARSAMETSDPELRRAEAFAKDISNLLSRYHRTRPIAGLMLAAPPGFLGILRNKLSDEIRQITDLEVPKALADMPLPEIQKSLLKNL